MFDRAVRMLQKMSSEDWAVAAFGASFFIGVWYAFPMVNTVTDVWPFGGGVLRAIEAHTLLPGYGVAYGTLTFYQNYVAMLIALALGFIAVGFDATAFTTLLILNPSYSLLVPRIMSALTGAVFLMMVYRFLKVHVASASWRLALLMLGFGNVLAIILTRTGKMWMLSMFLSIASFIYLYRALTEEAPHKPGTYSAISIVSAFLATANFAFAAVFLINIPILWYVFPKTADVAKQLAKYIALGAGMFLVFFALNAENTIGQVSGFVLQFFGTAPSHVPSVSVALTPFESFLVNARQAVESFPLLLLALIPALFAGIRNRVLANLAFVYIAVYMIAVSIIFRSDDGLALNIRHIFPIGFFLLFALAAYTPPPRWVARTFFGVGFAVYVYTLILLSIPTTYNAVYAFIENSYGEKNIRIDENIFELTLPMNKASYALYATSSCGSTCQHMRKLPNDIAFKPTVVTTDSDVAAVEKLPEADVLVSEREIAGCAPVARFGNSADVYDIDINLGRMLLPSFYTLRQLGKNIYIYDARECKVNL